MSNAQGQERAGAASVPVLLDTDIGSNVDDALCLAYLLRQRRCELLGITTVTGEPTVRAQLASAICQAFNRPEIPIHSGAAAPAIVTQRQAQAPQKDILANWPHQDKFKPNTAIDFLREMIHAWPAQITLLSIGPLTNIGLLFAVDPEIPRLLKQYVCMGGVYLGSAPHYGLTERNTSGDPHATSIVFSANVARMYCIGLDVTTQCKMPADVCRARFRNGHLKIIGDMAEVWFRDRSEVIFHDPLAAAVMFEPDLCAFQQGLVEIDLQAGPDQALTRFNSQSTHRPHQVAVTVNAEAFFEHYLATVSENPPSEV